MKRILVFFLFIAIVIGSVYAWMFLRPRPSHVLAASLNRFISAGVMPLQGSYQWEKADDTERNFHFGGWISFAGMIDLRDVTQLRGSGQIGYSSTPSQSDFESANIIVTKDRVAIQGKALKKERSEWMDRFAGTTTTPETWFSFERKSFLESLGYSGAVAKGNAANVRKTIQQMDLKKWITITSSSEQIYAGREYMTIDVRVNEMEMLNGLLSLIAAWKQQNPSDKDIVWARGVARDAAHGEWQLVIDERAKELVSISGKWRSVDTQEKILARNSVSLIFGTGLSSSPIMTKISDQAIDLTGALSKKNGYLPYAGERSTSSLIISTSTTKE